MKTLSLTLVAVAFSLSAAHASEGLIWSCPVGEDQEGVSMEIIQGDSSNNTAILKQTTFLGTSDLAIFSNADVVEGTDSIGRPQMTASLQAGKNSFSLEVTLKDVCSDFYEASNRETCNQYTGRLSYQVNGVSNEKTIRCIKHH